MPTLTINGQAVEATPHTRLVLAIENAGVPIGHRCGGKARCTTCRVTFTSGEPETYTKAEFAKLGLDKPDAASPGYRLSCQLLCDRDMEVEAVMTLENQSWSDTGPAVAEAVEPEAVWFDRGELEGEVSGPPAL